MDIKEKVSFTLHRAFIFSHVCLIVFCIRRIRVYSYMLAMVMLKYGPVPWLKAEERHGWEKEWRCRYCLNIREHRVSNKEKRERFPIFHPQNQLVHRGRLTQSASSPMTLNCENEKVAFYFVTMERGSITHFRVPALVRTSWMCHRLRRGTGTHAWSQMIQMKRSLESSPSNIAFCCTYLLDKWRLP